MKLKKLLSVLLVVLLIAGTVPVAFAAAGDPCVTATCTGTYTSSGYCRVCQKNQSGRSCMHDNLDSITLSCPDCGAKFSSCPHLKLDIFTHRCIYCRKWMGDPETCTHPSILSNGVCGQCGYCTESHSYKNGVCTVCEALCAHDGIIYGDVCDKCGGKLKEYEYTVSDDTATVIKYWGSGENITIPSSIDGYTVTAIGSEAFLNCESIKTVEIPDSVTNIGAYAFASTKLIEIKLSDGVTDIGDYAFCYNYDLATVIIPNSVETIGVGAFIGCSDFKIVHYVGSESEWNSIAVAEENNEELFAAQVHYVTIETQDATCTAGGTKTAVCGNGCGLTYKVADIGSPLGHSFTNYISENNATCTEDGTKTADCDNGCGKLDTVTDAGSAYGHTPSGWWLKSETEHWKHCVNDSCAEEIEGSRAAHSFGEWTETKPATATEDGEKVRSCECGYEQKETVPATGTPSDELCDHMCHKTGLMGLIWMVVGFLFKLFNINRTCDCGILHW